MHFARVLSASQMQATLSTKLVSKTEIRVAFQSNADGHNTED